MSAIVGDICIVVLPALAFTALPRQRAFLTDRPTARSMRPTVHSADGCAVVTLSAEAREAIEWQEDRREAIQQAAGIGFTWALLLGSLLLAAFAIGLA